MSSGPALVSILRQGDTLVASIHTALADTEMVRFQDDLVRQIGEHRAIEVRERGGAMVLRGAMHRTKDAVR